MIPPPEPGALPDRGGWLGELNSVDLAVYAAVAATPTPALDRAFRRLSRAADHSKLWLASAAVLAATGERAAAVPPPTAWPRPHLPRRSSTWC